MTTYYCQNMEEALRRAKKAGREPGCYFGGTIGTKTLRGVLTYMLWIGISLLIAIPMAVLVCERFLQNYAEHITGYWWIFFAAALLTVLLSLASVMWQTLKAAKTNPAIELKKE